MKIVDGRLYIRQVREMITVYTNALARDLTFQNLDEELVDPESKYCPPYKVKCEFLVNQGSFCVLPLVNEP